MWRTTAQNIKAEEESPPLQYFDDVTNPNTIVLLMNFSEDKSPSTMVRFPEKTLSAYER